jgi:hypothetical protein
MKLFLLCIQRKYFDFSISRHSLWPVGHYYGHGHLEQWTMKTQASPVSTGFQENRRQTVRFKQAGG